MCDFSPEIIVAGRRSGTEVGTDLGSERQNQRTQNAKIHPPSLSFAFLYKVSLKMSNEHLPVVWRDEPRSSEEYEAQRRRVYTLRVPDRFPLAIVRPRSVSQVISAVRLAIEKDVRVAIRSGGHSWACWSLRQDSVLIDFVDFKHLSYDAATDTLEASPGTIGTELVEYLQPKGRFLPGGHCATVALGGFLLQGGMGLNARVSSFLKAVNMALSNIRRDSVGRLRTSRLLMLSLQRARFCIVIRSSTRIYFGQLGELVQVSITFRGLGYEHTC